MYSVDKSILKTFYLILRKEALSARIIVVGRRPFVIAGGLLNMCTVGPVIIEFR